MNYSNKTKFPKLFGVYWGNFTYKEEEAAEMTPIFLNRNKFAMDYDLVEAKINCRFPSHGGQGIDYDHPEAYKCKNGKAILLFSNYADSSCPSSANLRQHGFVEYLQMYNSSAITFIRVFDSVREMSTYARKLGEEYQDRNIRYNPEFYFRLTKFPRSFKAGWGLRLCKSEEEKSSLRQIIRNRNRFAGYFNIMGGCIRPASLMDGQLPDKLEDAEIYKRKFKAGYVLLLDDDSKVAVYVINNVYEGRAFTYRPVFEPKRNSVAVELNDMKQVKTVLELLKHC